MYTIQNTQDTYGAGSQVLDSCDPAISAAEVQGHLAHKKVPPPRTLHQAYAQGPVVVLGEGLFLVSEVPL